MAIAEETAAEITATPPTAGSGSSATLEARIPAGISILTTVITITTLAEVITAVLTEAGITVDSMAAAVIIDHGSKKAVGFFMLALKLQPATTRDAAALAALHTAVADHLTEVHGQGPWSATTTEKGMLFAMRHSKVFIARSGREIVGTLRLTTKKPWAIDIDYFSPAREPLYLLAMAIAPAQQRKGLGRRCIEEAERIAKAWPAEAIRLDAYDAAAGAGEFYARCGFTERGRATYRGAPLIYYEMLMK